MQVENQQQLRVRLTLLVQAVVSINSCPAGGVLDGPELQPYYIGVIRTCFSWKIRHLGEGNDKMCF